MPERVDEYELIRLLGHGAMGQVYQAVDTLLGRPVAVKFIAHESPSDTARERFLIEARAIARLQHPNVVSIYRVGVTQGRPYLVSELVRGQSLDSVPLPMPWTRVLNIAVQLARGLAAAHLQGVLHRDLKPGNVMLTQEGTAKLLDFGLAKLSDDLAIYRSIPPLPAESEPVESKPGVRLQDKGSAPAAALSTDSKVTVDMQAEAQRAALNMNRAAAADSADDGTAASRSLPWSQPAAKSLTVVGSILGTPAYMPPEAWAGETATARSDVYSMGALLYELCCSHPPHDHERIEAICLAVMERDARPICEVAPRVDKRLGAIIDRCLLRDPALRFASGEELQKALEDLAAAVATPTERAVLGNALRRRWPVVLAAVVALIVLPFFTLYRFYQVRSEQRRTAALIKNRRSIALIGLSGLGSDTAHVRFSTAFTELLGTELTITEHFRRVPAESVARMKMDLKLAATDNPSREILRRIHQHLDADLIVLGSYQPDPGSNQRLRVNISVRETRSGARLAAAQVAGSPSELFELVTRTGMELRQQLGVGELSAEQQSALRAAKPASPESALFYAEGREKLRHFDAVGARKLLEKVIENDPDYPLGHLAMADVWNALGYDRQARMETRRAFKLSSSLPREDRYLVIARHRESQKEWDKAFEAYQILLTFFPSSLDYGLYLGKAQLDASQPEAALATTKKLRQLPGQASQDPRLDILEARCHSDRGDYSQAIALLESAVRKGETIDSPLLVARARLEESYVLSWMGQQEQALQSAAQAKPLFTASGDRGAAADTIMAMSSAYSYKGELDRALETAQEALNLLVRIENSSLIAADLCNMAVLLVKKGDLALAQSRAEGGLLLARQIDLKESVGTGYVVLGTIAMLQGNFTRALESFKEADSVLQELGDPRMVAWVDAHVAEVMTLRGDLTAARQKQELALAIRKQHGLSGFAAESQAALAAIDLEEQKWAQAEERARGAAEQFARDSQSDNQALALALLAQALAGQNRLPEAAQAIESAKEMAGKYQNRIIRLYVQRNAALLRLRWDKQTPIEAVSRELGDCLAAAHAAGMIVEELELRLAQLSILLSRGRSPELLNQVRGLAQEAQSHGFGLLAGKAAAILTAAPAAYPRSDSLQKDSP